MKNRPKCLWGNAIGVNPELWFSKPKKFKYRIDHDDYIPVGDKTTKHWTKGGFWITPTIGKPFQSADCICFLSENKEDVQIFTNKIKSELKYNTLWQEKLFRQLKNT